MTAPKAAWDTSDEALLNIHSCFSGERTPAIQIIQQLASTLTTLLTLVESRSINAVVPVMKWIACFFHIHVERRYDRSIKTARGPGQGIASNHSEPGKSSV